MAASARPFERLFRRGETWIVYRLGRLFLAGSLEQAGERYDPSGARNKRGSSHRGSGRSWLVGTTFDPFVGLERILPEVFLSSSTGSSGKIAAGELDNLG